MKREPVRQKAIFRSWFTAFSLLIWGIVSSQFVFSSAKKTPAEILVEIYTEVKEMGFRENENFLSREFNMDLDANAVNKEEYVMILSQKIDEIQKMVLEITYFEPDKKNPLVKNAKESREIKCELKEGMFEIKSCDYKDKELSRILNRILEGIKYKKALLKLVKKYTLSFPSV